MFNIYEHDGATVVELSDLPPVGPECDRYRAHLQRLAGATDRLILDCSRVRFFGAGFLSLLLHIHRQTALRADIVLCDLPEYGLEVLRLTGLDGHWLIYPTIEDALAFAPVILDDCPLDCVCSRHA